MGRLIAVERVRVDAIAKWWSPLARVVLGIVVAAAKLVNVITKMIEIALWSSINFLAATS